MAEKEKLRIDKYLWAIRLFKTRTLAAAACDSGKVKQNGTAVKAAKNVSVGDEYEVKTEAKKWQIKVTALLHNRVQFAEAIKYYIDLTPEEELVSKSLSNLKTSKFDIPCSNVRYFLSPQKSYTIQ